MSARSVAHVATMETACQLLIHELQELWREIGESDDERDAMLLQIEQECLAVYGRNVDDANAYKFQLQKQIDACKVEIEDISSSMGEQHMHCDVEVGGNLKEKLESIKTRLEDIRVRKLERKNQFVEVENQLQKISVQTGRSTENLWEDLAEERDLSLKKLEELHDQLADFQNEKSSRLEQVLDHLNTLNPFCVVLGMDFKDTICKIHPSLDENEEMKDVSNKTIDSLAAKIQSLRKVKAHRIQRLQDLAIDLVELWNLLNTPTEEQKMFQNVTSKIIASEPEITEPDILSTNFLSHVEQEVARLEQLKSAKIKEVLLKKKKELEETCRRTHMVTEALTRAEYSSEAIESGAKDPEYLLEQIELQIAKVKGEAFSRKEVLEKVNKWLAAREEECWLEEYNRDDNRYYAGKGAHLTLKRAEKARALVNKIPVMVEALTSKVTAWEKEKGSQFLYDGVPLLSTLEAYSSLRQEKELERQRERDQKKLQGQIMAEQEALYGSKPSPSKSGRKVSRPSIGAVMNNRKLSIGGAMLQNLKPEKAPLHALSIRKENGLNQKSKLSYNQSGGRKSSNIFGHVTKKHSSSGAKDGGKINSPQIRKPLSPIPLSLASNNTNIANSSKDHIKSQKETLPLCKIPNLEPLLSSFNSKEEENNKSPKKIQAPTTSTVASVSIQTTTPSYVSYTTKYPPKKYLEGVEYSFEEVRAIFLRKIID
ncbi:65-kDa microtubule-associated protein 4 isoform X2 [Carica papaya]|uniref:65-kDa microtubule-associated protein 4 isoform X2 n=1 Tax=Carica papaya TaxID=3649 RepID=UPI000B8CC83E|nr:65-kDa microtubule-associated protein 4 isoform X2 [Carica papaya]